MTKDRKQPQEQQTLPPQVKDLRGLRFGKLVVNRFSHVSNGSAYWLCSCDCSATGVPARARSLTSGGKKSCGCADGRFSAERLTTHGLSGTRAARTWASMRNRCSSNSSGEARKNYYEKGIRVCDRWMSLENFVADMGHPPTDQHTIDRIDSNGNYEPSNCRWATREEQNNNKSSNSFIEHDGKRMTIAQWARAAGIRRVTLHARLRRGWPMERALQPIGAPSNASLAKLQRLRSCEHCGSDFIPKQYRIEQGGGRFCSLSCLGQSRVGKRRSR